MSLSPATRLGPYEIVSRLGAGAMGEVYRAKDTRLGREVAIKILPADLAHDAGRRTRFESEARAVAALNHPNILGLYDIGSENDVTYIVTELVPGETLAALIERGPLPLKRLTDIAAQIADGMAAAHAARISHRDLKPANIMISGDGRVKILDFGLAKQTPVPTGEPDATLPLPQTQPGMILGTVDYMSPEQARGKETDYRSDQFSFGLILYEMATGKRAFDKPEPIQTLSAIITDEPPPIERNVPIPLRWVIDRCLSKEPSGRYESSRDLYQELRSVRDHISTFSTTQTPAVPMARHHFPWLIPAAFLAGVLAAAAVVVFRAPPPMPDQSPYCFTPFSIEPGGQFGALWSPDGKAVAYAARPSITEPYQVFIRYVESPTPVQLTHGNDGVSPMAWTPDGQRLLLDFNEKPGIWSIARVGGEPEVVVAAVPNSRVTAVSPDARSLAFIYPGADGRYGIWISSPAGSVPKRYEPDPFSTKDVYNEPKLKFSPDGKQLLLFINAGRQREEAWLMPFPADASRAPRLIFPDLKSYAGTPAFTWMPDSRHIVIAVSVSNDAAQQLWMADTRSGSRYALTSGTLPRYPLTVSPDGRKIIFSESNSNYDVVSVDLSNAAVRPLIATERDEMMPAWAANRKVLVFVTDRNGPQEIWLRMPDAADRPLVTARDFPPDTTQWLMGPALSPDADRVVYTKVDQGSGGNHLWISALNGGSPVPLTNDAKATEYPGSWSPDGAWFAYLGYRDGASNLMKVKTTGQAGPVVVSADASSDDNSVPSWSPDGKWIVFGDNLYSSEDGNARPLGEHRSDGYAFSKDGKLLYGMRREENGEVLFSVDVATGAEKVIGNAGYEARPRSSLNPAVRLSLTPGGNSLVFGTFKPKSSLWMLEGFALNTGLLARLGL
jgi:serine/threonine protein kinase/Tol biopolymer transport system component